MKRRGERKRALGTRRPRTSPEEANQRRSLDFASDALIASRRFRILAVVDDFSRESLALMVDNPLSGVRVVRKLDRVATVRGYPQLIVSDNGTELTSNAIFGGQRNRGSSGTTSLPASQCTPASLRASTGGSGTSA